MGLPAISILLFFLGIICSFIGLLLKSGIGKGILILLVIALCVFLMIDGNLPDFSGAGLASDTNVAKASRYLLFSGGSCVFVALLFLLLNLLRVS
ncbi:hypothetical protein AM218_10140 [Hymenobacter sp. DG25A]|nr:hypothetical protein AM218_10140 [Hymenobacter sp. DG25A]